MLSCFKAITEHPARTLGLEGYGLETGCHADLVVLQGEDPVEAIRLRPSRLYVIRRGKIIAQNEPARIHLDLPSRPPTIDLGLKPT
jgi:cytosine deaminase